MAITVGNLKTYKSDTVSNADDNGGTISKFPVIDGQIHNVFDDVSSGDRVTGAVRLRKIFHKVDSQDRDVFLKARAMLTRIPLDTSVDVTAVYTGDQHDRQNAVKKYIESYRVPTFKSLWQLLEVQYSGSKALTLFARVGTLTPQAGDMLFIRSSTSTQYVRVSEVAEPETRKFVVDDKGTEVERLTLRVTLTERLGSDFNGASVTLPPATPDAKLFETTINPIAKYYSVRPLKVDAQDGEKSVTLESVFSQLVPSQLREIPFVDQPIFSLAKGIISSGLGTFERNVPFAVGNGTVINLNVPVFPTSINFLSVSDDGAGNLIKSGAVVGSIDYTNGSLEFSSDAIAPAGSKSLSFTPAYLTTGVPQTAYLEVSDANVGNVFAGNLNGEIIRGSLKVQYPSFGKWYTLTDNYKGQLEGGAGIGSGTINYDTASWTLDLAELPDVGSGIVLSWLEAPNTLKPSNTPVASFIFEDIDMTPATHDITLSWDGKSAVVSNTGNISVDASGSLRGGVLTFKPDILPAKGTNLTITATPRAADIPNVNGESGRVFLQRDTKLAFTGVDTISGSLDNSEAIKPRSVRFSYNTRVYIGNTIVRDVSFFGNIGYNTYANYTKMAIHVKDDGAGKLIRTGDNQEIGTIDYTTGDYTLNTVVPENVLGLSSPTDTHPYFIAATGAPSEIVGNARAKVIPGDLHLYGNISAIWTVVIPESAVPTTPGTSTPPAAYTKTLTLNTVDVLLDLPPLANINQGLQLKFSGNTYQVYGGVSYKIGNVGEDTPVGQLSGDKVTLSDWVPGSDMTVTIDYLAVTSTQHPQVNGGVFVTPKTPTKPQTFSIKVGSDQASADANGDFSQGVITGSIRDLYGLVKYELSSGRPLNTISYSVVSQEFITLPSSAVGIDMTRLPVNGRVRVFEKGDSVVIFNEVEETNTYNSNSTTNLGRTNIKFVTITDANGALVPATAYTVDLDAGTVTWGDLANIAQPLKILHRIESERLIEEVYNTGKIVLDEPVSGVYPKGTSYASSIIRYKDLQSNVSTPFSQKTWTDEWSNERIGTLILPVYRDAEYPIIVDNLSCITDRWLVQFTSSNTVNVISESLGVVLENVPIGSNISPTNPATGFPYFTIQSQGWGGGWVSGNCLRFNTIGAYDNVWLVEAISKTDPTVTGANALTTCVEFRGDANT